MKIIGAGMSGCLAGVLFPDAQIYEQSDIPPINHNAVLRFRDDSVSNATGIPFKKVIVHKGIWAFGEYYPPSIRYANMYSQKVLGHIRDRSIWNIEPVTRWIAPSNFQELLYNIVENRVHLDYTVHRFSGLIISTIPLKYIATALGLKLPFELHYQRINVTRYRINICDVYQTVYFPGPDTRAYRATITGCDLIIESIGDLDSESLKVVLSALSINEDGIGNMPQESVQKFGKILDVDDTERKKILYEITSKHNIYSLGRYAIWKNILMDDVLKDIYVIKQMIAYSDYNKSKAMI